jgi:long-chain acyl-CoA synthetase
MSVAAQSIPNIAQRFWTKHYDAGVPTTIEYPNIMLWELVKQSADKYPANTALHFLGKDVSYRELWDSIQRFATALQAMGVKKGDRVGVMLPNCPQFLIAFYGTNLAGATVVAINPIYTPRELEHLLKDSECETLVILDLKYPVFREVAGASKVRRTIVTGIQDYLPFPKNFLFPIKAKKDGVWVDIKPAPDLFSFKKLLAKHPAPPSKVASDPAEDVAMLLYTGGTTGFPKAAMLTNRNLVANAIQCHAWVKEGTVEGKTVAGGALPFFHSYGLSTVMNLTMRIGGTIILFPKFDVAEVVKSIQKFKINIFSGVPTMYVAINNYPDLSKYDLSSITGCTSGGAALPVEVKAEFERNTGGKLVEGYGLSESSPVLTSNPLHGEARSGCIGVPFPDTEVRIVDENGNTLSFGEVGELCAAGPQVMKGYWNRPEETAKTLRTDENGKTWLFTGDMARMDEEGFLYIADRKKELILVGGFNVFPREVEEVLYEHPKVQEAVVAGIKDKYMGETVKAYIVLREGETLTAEEVIAFCKERLASYKVPRFVEFRKELPKTMIGKILRRVLIEEEEARAKAAEEHA